MEAQAATLGRKLMAKRKKHFRENWEDKALDYRIQPLRNLNL